MSDDGHEYYYNELTNVSTWESPTIEWEHNINTRYQVLYRSLVGGGRAGGQVRIFFTVMFVDFCPFL